MANAAWNIEKIEEDLRYKEYFCRILDKTRPDCNIDELYRENQGNLIGDFIGSFQNHELSEVEQKALQYGLEALLSLSSNDRKGEG